MIGFHESLKTYIISCHYTSRVTSNQLELHAEPSKSVLLFCLKPATYSITKKPRKESYVIASKVSSSIETDANSQIRLTHSIEQKSFFVADKSCSCLPVSSSRERYQISPSAEVLKWFSDHIMSKLSSKEVAGAAASDEEEEQAARSTAM